MKDFVLVNLSNFGLILDIIGGIMIFFYGIPNKIDRDGHIHLILEQEDEEEKIKAKKYDFLAHIGLILLILGFLLQFIGNIINKLGN